MSSISSACPDNLQKFVQMASESTKNLVSQTNSLRQSYDEFQTSGGDYPVSNAGLMDSALPDLARTQQTTDTFVEVTKAAFLAADAGASPSAVISVPTAALDAKFDQICAANHINPAQLSAIPTAIQATPMTVGAIPMDSGFVDDPVCTATGHFTEVEKDFVVASRLATLAWPRYYSSRLLDDTGHGPGWWSWASTAIKRISEGVVEVTVCDGRRGSFVEDHSGQWSRLPGIEAQLFSLDQSYELRWDVISAFSQQVWSFDRSGRLLRVDGQDLEPCSFTYSRGHLVKVAADSGRSVDLSWDHDRIAALSISDGRRVNYRYASHGGLLEVNKAEGDRRYDAEESGLIRAVFDADGVRLCFNNYDQEGRVTSQISPLGRETILEYLPNGSTRVRDTEDGPAAIFEHDSIGRLVGVINAEGDRFSRTFDELGRVSAQRDFDGSEIQRQVGADSVTFSGGAGETRTWDYDRLGRLSSCALQGGGLWAFEYQGSTNRPRVVTNPGGGATTVEYDDRGLVSASIDPDGVRVDFTHDSDGMPVSTTDAAGSRTLTEYHPAGGPSLLSFADGSRWRIEYDDAGRPVAAIDPLGNQTSMEYTPAGRVFRVIDPLGNATSIRYASSGEIDTVTDPNGAETEFRFDYLGSPVGISNPDGSKWEFAYTLLGQLSTVTAPDGAQRQYGYDQLGRNILKVDPLGFQVKTSYDASGRPVGTTDEAGNSIAVTYDLAGNPATCVDAEGAVSSMTWDGMGRLTSRTDPDGVVEEYSYSPAGRLLRAVFNGVERVYHYDRVGRIESMVVGGDATWRYQYDARNRLQKVTSPEGRITSCLRDPAGRVIEVEEQGRRSLQTLDAAGRLVAVKDSSGSTRRFKYDPRGRMLESTAATGAVTRHAYDLMGRLVEEVEPRGGKTRRSFDHLGRITEYSDPLGRKLSFSYDRAGRLARRTSSDETISYIRTPTGLVTDVMVDGKNMVVMDHDKCGRRTSVHETARARTDLVTYSPAGRILTSTDGGAGTQWEYDSNGLVATLTDQAGISRHYRYDRRGHLQVMSCEQWGDIDLTRDADGILTAIDWSDGRLAWNFDGSVGPARYSSQIGERSYSISLSHNAEGRVSAVEDSSGSTSTMSYDPAGRLVEVSEGERTTSWSWDQSGQRTSQSVSTTGDDSPSVTSWSYDDAGQLSSRSDSSGVTEFAYDVAGRRVSESGPAGSREFRWDVAGRLRSIDGLDLEVDSEGLLIRAGETSIGWDRSRDLPEVTNIGDTSVISVDGHHLGTFCDGDLQWAATDWRGSPTGSGPWGESRDAVPEPHIGFLGELEVGGLVWLRDRVYDPFSAQFLSRDSLPPVPGAPASPYQYANDDPFGWLDPSGMRPVSIAAFNQTRKAACSVQWGTIAAIGVGLLAAAVTVALMPEDIGVVGMMAIGAGTGMVGGATPALVNWATTGHLDTGALVKGMVVGGVTGAMMGGAGGFLPETTGLATVGVGIGAGTAGGALSHTLGNLYDYTGLPGSNETPPDWSLTGSETSAGTGAVTGLLSGGVTTAIKGSPEPQPQLTPVDPNTTTYTQTPSGLVVPNAPNGMQMNPSGLYVPKPGTTPMILTPAPTPVSTGAGGGTGALSTPPPPAGYTQTPSGIYIPK